MEDSKTPASADAGGPFRPRLESVLLLSLLLTVAALVLTHLTGLARGQPGLGFFYLALLLGGLLGGLRGALVTAVLAIIAVLWFVIPPIGQFHMGTTEPVRLVTFAVSSVLVGLASESFHQARFRAEQGRRSAETLAAELAQKAEELKEREATARALSAQLQEAQQLAGLGTWEFDPRSDRVLWSEEMCAIHGVSRAEAPTTLAEYLDFVHPGDRPMITAMIAQAFETHVPWSFELRIVRRDGAERIVTGRGEVLTNPDGQSVHLFGTATDVTERRRAEQQERALIQERAARAEADAARLAAEAANLAKMRTLAVTSHDLRTPLNAIGGYAQLMEMGVYGPISDRQRDALARIAQNQVRLTALVDQLLAYARVETGHVAYRIDDVPLDPLISGLEASIAIETQRRELCYEYERCAPDVQVRGDRERIEQVLLNLLTNAIKYSNPGGRIAVDCVPRDGFVGIRVHDTGPGIPADKLQAIFEPYVRLQHDETEAGRGVGLGLAISRELARGMGGDVVVESETGVGSTFTLWLPSSQPTTKRPT